MGSQNLNFYTLFHLLPLFLLSVLVLNSLHVRGRSSETFKRKGSTPANGTVKTVEGDNGDVVDCVDIYKQPALNHPLLKHHKIQMDPSSSISKLYQNNSAKDFTQTWQKKGICSEGTVPIQRRQLQGSNSGASARGPHNEHAGIIAVPPRGQRFYGGGGDLSIWEPAVTRTEDFSASALMVALSKRAYIMAGWIVHPELYGDSRSRIFIYWTIDDSISTGCFDLHCEGFVQVSKDLVLGAALTPISTLGSDTYSVLRLVILLDRETGNWWLRYKGELIGYWPAALFTGIPEGAEKLGWGGQIFDSVGSSRHTETDMGNGLFPNIAANKASIVCSLKYVDSSFTLRTPVRSSLRLDVTNPLCYNARLFPTLRATKGLCFLFGGSGRNPKCP